jgi:DNA-binding NtrC family response regulator
VLLVEDEPDQAAILEAVLRHEGLDVVVASSAEQALEIHQRTPADVLVTDLNLPGMTGVDLMRRLSPPPTESAVEPKAPPPAVVVVTGAGTVASAVAALKLGAADYLQKPLDPARLVSLVRELLASDNVREVDGDDETLTGPLVFEGMVGGSKRMRDVFARIDRVAGTMAPVLIVGESGTGKELVARAIHNRSRRRTGPFVPVHTGAIPRELIGSELFGHEKGSFTGAFTAAEGKFEAACGGTVFLDEVGTMDAAVQVSLLRVLETYRFTRVGGRKEIEADVRVVAATNKDLLDLVDDNVFREDLYYRLNVFTVTLPPLRERAEDILPIAERFLTKYAKRYGAPARQLAPGAVERLLAHDWPGNVRELRNVMEQTALFAPSEVVGADDVQLGQGRIERRPGRRSHEGVASTLPPSPVVEATPRDEHAPAASEAGAPIPVAPAAGEAHSSTWPSPAPPAPAPARAAASAEAPPPSEPSSQRAPGSSPLPLGSFPRADELAPHEVEAGREPDGEHPLVLRLPVGTRLADAERRLILLTLDAVRGNKQRAARVLGISRRGLDSKLQSYGEHFGAHEVPEADAPVEASEAEAPSEAEPRTEGKEAPEGPGEPPVGDAPGDGDGGGSEGGAPEVAAGPLQG